MQLKEVKTRNVLTLPIERRNRLLVCCAAAIRHEERGEYSAAVDVLSGFWPDPTVRPDTSQMGKLEAARLLVRAGSLTALIGSQRQAEGWQGRAKDLLSEAAALAESVGDTKLWLESQKHLGTCYWREGGFAEARVVTEAAIARSEPATDLGLTLRLNLAIIETSERHHDRAMGILDGIAVAVTDSGSDYVRAMFHNGRALTHKALGAVGLAIIEMVACCFHLERAGHRPYLIGAEINLANLLVQAKRAEAAHVHLERAERLAQELGDSIHLAHAMDSRSQAFMAEREYESAEVAAQKAVSILDQGDESGLLVDFLSTLGRAQAGAGHLGDSLKTYLRAYDLASDRVSGKRAARVALDMIGELAGEMCLEARLPFEDVNHKFQESIFRAALESTDGRVTEASMKLGMTQANLSWHLNNRYTHLRIQEKRKKGIIRHPLPVKPPKK